MAIVQNLGRLIKPTQLTIELLKFDRELHKDVREHFCALK